MSDLKDVARYESIENPRDYRRGVRTLVASALLGTSLLVACAGPVPPRDHPKSIPVSAFVHGEDDENVDVVGVEAFVLPESDTNVRNLPIDGMPVSAEVSAQIENSLQFLTYEITSFPQERHEEVKNESRDVFVYVMHRMGTPLKASTHVVYAYAANGGLADTGNRVIYNNHNDWSIYTALYFSAHELAHQLSHDRYGDAHLSAEVPLSEGLATYGAGELWMRGHKSFKDLVNSFRANGTFMPLTTRVHNDRGEFLPYESNTMYPIYASFVEFIIEEYGWEKFDALYVTGQSWYFTSDYESVFGKTYEQIVKEWELWLDE